MATYKKTIRELPLIFESQHLTPDVRIFMISVEGDPLKFPMIYKKEFGGWFFVDKMTLIEFVDREKEISAAIEILEAS